VNFYQHHIGDFDVATAHLTACEDGIYSRLVRRYYATEKPLEPDIAKLQRLVRARTKDEKQAVVDVLNEFFFLREDGWHDEKINLAIEEFLAGEPEREVKKANEDNRLKRHRDERARLFKIITDAGEHAPWNTPIAELRELAKSIADSTPAPETATQPATAPATPATATQYPSPNTQYPSPIKKKKGAKAPLSADQLPPRMEALVALYHEVLPELPAVRVMDREREQALRDFWNWVLTTNRPDGPPRATNDDEVLAWTRDYFGQARESDFIMGRGKRSPEHKNWRCSIEYLLSSRGIKKILEETQAMGPEQYV
jgi:uncharacterized protein YdaU (DUF1376 family)